MKNDNKNIKKYFEYLKENIQDTPESYVESALTKLKNRIEKMFSPTTTVEDGEVKKYGEVSNDIRKEKGGMSFTDLGLEMQSLELSKYSKLYDNLKLKFSDEQYLYDVTFTIDLKDAVPEDTDKDFSDKDIKKCQVKFKKYTTDDFTPQGNLIKTVKISDINEEFLISLKIELDEDNGGEEEEFEIET
jgi:hypothetical protein